MRAAIMQPYWFPYLGYYQLIALADSFVLYDDIEYTKRGWINRNRVLQNGAPHTITVPLAKGSDYLDVRDRRISDSFDRARMLHMFRQAYARAPFVAEAGELLAASLAIETTNLFDFLKASLALATDALDISTSVLVSSAIGVDRNLKSQDRVLETCRVLGADNYVNPIGGIELYDSAAFASRGIDLTFLRSLLSPYPQQGLEFVPALSVLDVVANVGFAGTRNLVQTDFLIETPKRVAVSDDGS